MANLNPQKLILRCYGYRTRKSKWFGLCLELNLAVEVDSPVELKEKMNEVIVSYIDTVMNTNDKDSIPELFARHAPLHDYLIYYAIRAINFISQFPNNLTFKEIIPFHLAHSC